MGSGASSKGNTEANRLNVGIWPELKQIERSLQAQSKEKLIEILYASVNKAMLVDTLCSLAVQDPQFKRRIEANLSEMNRSKNHSPSSSKVSLPKVISDQALAKLDKKSGRENKESNSKLRASESKLSLPYSIPRSARGLGGTPLSAAQMLFFFKYGFLVMRGLHSQSQIDEALAGALHLIGREKLAIAKDGKRNAFGNLPEGNRPSWARCEYPALTQFFKFKQNEEIMSKVVGNFKFKHHDGPGFYVFAPRFHQWSANPKSVSSTHSKVIPPYNPSNLPSSLSNQSRKFILDAAGLNVRVAKCENANWHIDGENNGMTMVFSCLWGSYINALPNGNMGNLLVYPGSHHVLAHQMQTKNTSSVWKGGRKPSSLYKQNVCDGYAYQLCVQAGDIVIAHPWLAHGIGTNTSNQDRLAVYCRLNANDMFWPPASCQRSKVAGTKLSNRPWTDRPKQWKGDYFATLPGLRKWINSNKSIIRNYDGGQLNRALKTLDLGV
eukprot:CAMPEP_0167758544 /NCGR_PEP_ID=MMETSP0110_2-20121227/10526_1 /TAXON_ID=629695 /ORGANISM="Gymnochlora sp., Strain CCMP2014" /LENGTH=494 /DNA_ID=CAMNT_0007644829 /DNA_START=83 /DNA_END=1567 /DNA_ORIENTATION=-